MRVFVALLLHDTKEQVAEMKRFGKLGVALLAVLALGALVASGAQAAAPYWSIEGSRLKAGQTHNIQARSFEGKTFVLSAGGNTITCKTLALKNGVLLGSEEGSPGTNHELLVFAGCTAAQGGTECGSVKSTGEAAGKVTTNSLKSELVEDATNKKLLLVEFTPENTTEEFLKLEFTAPCTVLETKVTGQDAAAVKTDPGKVQVELGVTAAAATSWLLEALTTEPSEVCLVKTSGSACENTKLEKLKAFGVTATETGTALVLLAANNGAIEEKLWSPLP